MKKILLIFCLILFVSRIFAQQFSQYNTGSLYDSFENPSQKAFIPDTSRMYASNFLFPNVNANFFLSGNTQRTLRSRQFTDSYNNSALKFGEGRFNHLNFDANVYLIMFKMFSSFNGDTELGFAYQTKFENKGFFSDESIALLNGTNDFKNGTYNNIFNDRYHYQSYNQMSFTYKEKVDDQLTLGIKLSALFGIQYQELNVINSQAIIDRTNEAATVSLAGAFYDSNFSNRSVSQYYLSNFHNPGASVTLGATYRTEDNFVIQTNIKDLGFIHWSGSSNNYFFNNTTTINGLGSSNPFREDSVYRKINKLIRNNNFHGSFSSVTDGRAEVSVMKNYWIDDNHNFKYSPTLIASKELFYPGFVAALVNPFQYDKFVITVTTTYDDLKIFNLGSQFMIKTPNFDFFIGSDKLIESGSLLDDQIKSKATNSLQNDSFTGASLYLGFSMKFGPVTEHPLNSSTIPLGEPKGFLGRLWDNIFKSKDEIQ